MKYITSIQLPGMDEPYFLKPHVTAVYPVTCPKCGASFELVGEKGKCDYCGTFFSATMTLKEVEDAETGHYWTASGT